MEILADSTTVDTIVLSLARFTGRFVFAAVVFGWIPAIIAKSKGRSFWRWWLYGTCFTLIALIHSIFVVKSDKNKVMMNWNPPSRSLRRDARIEGLCHNPCHKGQSRRLAFFVFQALAH